MDPIALTFAFGAGAAGALNPCGIALLPSYLAYLFVQAGRTGVTAVARLGRGAAAGGLMTLGFLVLFTAAGLLVGVAVEAVRAVLPWVTVGVGAALIVLGVLMLAGRKPRGLGLSLPLSSVAGRTGAGYGAFFAYGLAFATASLSCTLPVFLVVVAQAFGSGLVQGVAGFAAYALGMGLVVSALSVGVMVARETAERWLRGLLPHVERASAALVIAAGAYLSYYWLWGPGAGVR